MEERNCPMEDPFAFLTLNFLKKSEIFPAPSAPSATASSGRER